MQYLTYVLPLAAIAAANPLERRGWGPGAGGCESNECLAAVTGKAALGDDKLRGEHCSSFLATTVTPPAVTVTSTVTGESSKWEDWKRDSVTVCPNDVPNYASACDEKGYSSACSCYGYTEVKTTTLAPTTTTEIVYVKPTSCDGQKTVTVTKDKPTSCDGQKTVTVTATVTEKGGYGGGSGPTGTPGKNCLSDSDAEKIVNNFITLLEFTSYNGTRGAPGRGYKQDVSDATLDENFVDISDSINFMAGIPLGSVTFPNKAAFDIGQGQQQPEIAVDTLNIFHGCRDITWRYKVTPPTQNPYPVNGLNYMQINEKGLIQKQYAEFDNGAWLQSYPGGNCAIAPVSVAPTTALKARMV